MTAPIVLIEIAEPDRTSPFVATLLEACSKASLEGPCALAEATGEDAAPALAILGWQDDHRTAHLEVGLRRNDHAEWLTRRIEFGAEDREVERWRTTGLVIATLAGDARAGVTARTETASARPAPAPTTTPTTPRDATPSKPPSPAAPLPKTANEARPLASLPAQRFWIDLGPALGSGLDRGAPRLGAFVAGAYCFPHTPLLARVALRAAGRPRSADNLKLVWGSFGLGLGVVLSPSAIPLRFDVRGELSGELIDVSVMDASGASDQATRLSLGARAGGDVAWMPLSSLGLVVGGEATFARGITLRVHDKAVARQAPVGYSVLLGARISVP